MNVIETERLLLRGFKEEDIPTLHSVFSDAETMEFYPAPFRYDQTKSWVKRNQIRYKEDGFGLWAVCLKESGELNR
ncbi:RimJ/RimL family protein N-acetyltransferase [Salirhabdus euzebyi]|uniref:RimJ/RimL family protein N-acetyltransferase n=1 Tax=Salirhabdus euzebyi TaxID=394506 RepID=A0A841Q295_9BACI|nr:RimJ/RimL family protein N-acetyltransferase [Salirhabdus euzebyi]